MVTKLDHIYGGSGNITALENKVDNLSQITAKTNLAQTFTGIQTFQNGARSNATITNAKDLTTKEYVDNFIGQWVTLETWTGNFKTTGLVWTKTAQFANAGKYEFIINIKNGDNNYQYNSIVNIEDVTKTYFLGEIMYYNADVSAIQNPSTNGCYFVYSNKSLRIGKIGQTQPEANTQVKILYRGVR